MEHVAIIRHVRLGYETQFETALREFLAESMSDDHTTGAQMIRPLEGSEDLRYGILRSFPDAAAKEAFYASKAYARWKERVAPMVEGEAERQDIHGLEAFFRDTETPGPPPRWKMAIVTWIGVNLATTPLLVMLMPILVGTLGLPFPFENFAFNVVVVSLLTWAVMPLLIPIFGGWLEGKGKTVPAATTASSLPADQGVKAAQVRWHKLAELFLERTSSVAIAFSGYAVMRIGVGVLMAYYHGFPKLAAAPGYFFRDEAWRDVDLVVALGLPFPGLMSLMAGLIQFVCALAIAVGVFSRASAALILSTLVVAYYWNMTQGSDNQLVIIYMAMLIGVFVVGNGRHNLNPFPSKS